MTTIASTTCGLPISQQAAEAFGAMLPAIERVAAYGFRRSPHHRRQELISDAVAHAYVTFMQLVNRGKIALAYPTILAGYAIRRIRDGRQVGCRRNSRDVLSHFAQRRRGFAVQPLHEQRKCGKWVDLFVEDHRSNPADLAALKLDFTAWLRRLDPRSRAIALDLAAGNAPIEAAQRFGVSPARITQVRRRLQANWNDFQKLPAP